MFITVTCCEGIAKKLFEEHFFLQLFTHNVPYIQVTAGRSSEVFQLQQLAAFRIIALQIRGLSGILHLDFQDKTHFLGLSWSGNPESVPTIHLLHLIPLPCKYRDYQGPCTQISRTELISWDFPGVGTLEVYR